MQIAKLSMDDMEARGSNGGPRPWSYRRREQAAAGPSSYTVISSSSSAGTTVSTAYTSSGTGSRHSSTPTFHCIGIHDGDNVPWEETDKEEQMKRITSLVQECFGAPPSSTDTSIRCCDDMPRTCLHMVALERWFTELGVGWVLHVASSSGVTTTSTFDTWSWIRALAEIMETIRLTTSISPVRGLAGMPTEELATTSSSSSSSPDQLKFAQFFCATMLKMLSFVDVLVGEVVVTKGGPVPYMRLSNLLGVHGALSRALSDIWLLFHSPPSAQVEAVEREMASLLSAKEAKAGEAIWSMMEQIRASILESMDDGDDDAPLQGSSGIHKSTVSIMTYIKFLHKNYLSISPVVSEAASLGKYVPIRNIRPLDSMIIEIVSCFQEKLANITEPFRDNQALGFLFLLNNSYFILEHLNLTFASLNIVHVESITHKVKAYMDSYIQVSWAPMLSCLLNPAPLCFRRNNYSQLPKFESKFQKICSAQREWKVPDPKLRKELRKAITEKVILRYTEYIDDNKVTTPKFSPQELEEVLQELFEG